MCCRRSKPCPLEPTARREAVSAAVATARSPRVPNRIRRYTAAAAAGGGEVARTVEAQTRRDGDFLNIAAARRIAPQKFRGANVLVLANVTASSVMPAVAIVPKPSAVPETRKTCPSVPVMSATSPVVFAERPTTEGRRIGELAFETALVAIVVAKEFAEVVTSPVAAVCSTAPENASVAPSVISSTAVPVASFPSNTLALTACILAKVTALLAMPAVAIVPNPSST